MKVFGRKPPIPEARPDATYSLSCSAAATQCSRGSGKSGSDSQVSLLASYAEALATVPPLAPPNRYNLLPSTATHDPARAVPAGIDVFGRQAFWAASYAKTLPSAAAKLLPG